jgi:hypothetical protein
LWIVSQKPLYPLAEKINNDMLVLERFDEGRRQAPWEGLVLVSWS